MRNRGGIFITLEGTEGAGKSTLIRLLAQRLTEDWGFRVVMTREPGGSPIAERIRKVILDEAVTPLAELFLYEAARAEHVERTVRPALLRGDVVLCDRFTDSSLAYQAFARGLPWKQVKALNRIATQALTPDLTVLLDIDPLTGLQRAQEQTRFEAEGVEFQKRVREGFLKSRKENPKRWLVLKVATKKPEELADSVIEVCRKRFPKQFPKQSPKQSHVRSQPRKSDG